MPDLPDLPDACHACPLIPEHVAFERLLGQLSARFLNLPVAEIDVAITDALRQIVAIIGVDRSQLIHFPPVGDEGYVTHSCAVDGVPSVAPTPLLAKFPWSVPRLRAGQVVVIPRVDDLPPEAAVDRASFQRVGAKSQLGAPMFVAGQVVGELAFACVRHERDWPEALIERIRILAEVFANALAHKRSREDLDAALRFERTASDVLGTLLAAPRALQDKVLEAGLREVGRSFDADRVTLWQRGGEDAEFTKSHRWLAEGLSAPSGPLAARLPWIAAQLAQGAVVRFGRLADLPPDAAADMAVLHAIGIGAGVVVPLDLAGTVAGALSIATTREHVAWPDALLPRARLFGSALASFLARQQSEQRELEAQAQAAHAARVATMGVFAASLVHELTQPLAASLANAETAAEMLALDAPDVAELRETVADIIGDTRRAGELIQKLRRFLRHGEAERAEIDLAALLADVLSFVAREKSKKGVELVLDVDPGLPHVTGDRVQLQQVLLNLLLNAFDAVAAQPTRRVTVRARAEPASLVVEVGDSGTGMDEATLARIFQPFFSTRPGGMGLGLAICQTIVSSHGGVIGVRSVAGEGATFRVELPLQQALVVAAKPLAAPQAAATETVYLVDDDDAMRRAIERQLAAEGWRVVGFANAHAFLDHVPRAEVGCIVTDLRMPGASGLDLQATLVRAGNALPLIFVSGHADVPTSVQAMRGGALAFLQKPFAKAELLAAVRDALAASRERARERGRAAELMQRHRTLTPRETEVFDLVVQGLLNKLVADRLGIAERTVKIHRAHVMEKMHARSVAELVRMAQAIAAQQAPPAAPGRAGARLPA